MFWRTDKSTISLVGCDTVWLALKFEKVDAQALISPPEEVFLPVCSVSAISVFSSMMSGVAAVGTLSHWSIGISRMLRFAAFFLQFEGPFCTL